MVLKDTVQMPRKTKIFHIRFPNIDYKTIFHQIISNLTVRITKDAGQITVNTKAMQLESSFES